jgi:hypothetical protein
MLEPEGVEEYSTPKLNEEKTGSEYHHTDLEEDEDESAFLSPLKARKKPTPRPVADSDNESLTGTDDGSLEAKRNLKGDKNLKTNTGKRAFREMVQEKRAMTTANNKRTNPKPAGNSKVRISTSHF